MGKYSYYDPKENVIFTDLSSVGNATTQDVDDVVDEAIEIARTLPEKVFMVVCWKDVKIDANVAKHYGGRAADLIKGYLRGIVRYSATNAAARVHIRAEALKHDAQNSQANIFNTKEEALEAIRTGKIR